MGDPFIDAWITKNYGGPVTAAAKSVEAWGDKLAALNMTGGNIRNIALNAAFLAAAEGTPVAMEHLLQATRQEAIKIERPLSDMEIRGWV